MSINYSIVEYFYSFVKNILYFLLPCIFFSINSYSVDEPLELTEDYERIMSLKYEEGYELLEALFSYEVNGIWYLPLYPMVEALGLNIKISSDLGVIDGYIIREDNPIHIEMKTCDLNLKKNNLKYECKKLLTFMNDIYITHDLLELIFPLKIIIESFDSIIKIKVLDQFPSYEKFKRGEKKTRDISIKAYDPGYKIIEQNYDYINGFFMDQSVRSSVTKTTESTTYNISSRSAFSGEILKMMARYFITTENGSINSQVLTFNKKDKDGKLLGPLKTTEFNIYDINGFSEAQVGSNGSLKGVYLTNIPLNNNISFTSHRFTGPLDLGWEVELYQNDFLVNKYSNDSSNEINKDNTDTQANAYLFDNIPLIYGENNFRFIFYGPQGQRRIEHQKFNISSSVLNPDSGLLYKFSLGENLYDKYDSYLYFEHYIFLGLSSGIGMQNLYNEKTKLFENYKFFKMNGFFRSLAYQFNYYQNEKKGNAIFYGLNFSFLGISIRYDEEIYKDYQSLSINRGGNAFSSNEIIGKRKLALMGKVPFVDRLSFALDTKINYLKFRKDIQLVLHKNYSLNSIMFSNLLAQTFTLPDTSYYQYSDQFRVSFNVLQMILQANANFSYFKYVEYDPKQKGIELNSIALSTNIDSRLGYSMNFKYSINISDIKNIHSISAGIKKNFSLFSSNFNISLNSNSNFSALLSFDFSLVRNSVANKLYIQSAPQSNLGAADVHVYYDKNGNMNFDEGDESASDIQIRLHQRNNHLVTDKDGRAFFSNLSDSSPLDFSVIESSINSINIAPLVDGFRIYALAGKTSKLSFPLSSFAEIAGTLIFENSPLKGAPVEIFNADSNEFIKFSYTSSDGSFLIPRIVPGNYFITINQKYLKDRNYKLTLGNKKILVDSEMDYIDDIEIEIEKYIWPEDEVTTEIPSLPKGENEKVVKKELIQNTIVLNPNTSSSNEDKNEISESEKTILNLEKESNSMDNNKDTEKEKLYEVNEVIYE